MALARCVPPLRSRVPAIRNCCTFSSDLSNHTVTGLNLASWKKRRKLLLLDEKVFVKMRHNRELVGVLHGFDSHLNLILGNVDETLTTLELDEETYEEIYKTTKRSIPLLFVRGDGIILISPPQAEQ
ncbi:U6 snRNA-associated Sm-like protein LSm3 [Echinococcus granulosus]|nr:U6 snRNA-associated Sm-like protein LSm3 [Echinococcus granulosus]